MVDWPRQAKKKAMPNWTSPMLATLTHEYFSDPNWIYERKLDGERCLVRRENGKVTLLSRNEKTLNDTYPELEEAFEKLEGDFIMDGEIVAFEGDVTSFSRLQKRMQKKDREEAKASNVAVYCYLFDLIYADGYQLTDVPLRERKALLKKRYNFEDPLCYTAHRNEEGEAYHKQACEKGWEGIIAKDARSIYCKSRTKNWLKFKCVHQQEFVIVGYTEPHGDRIGFGALLIGYYEDDELHYAGQVGTGYDDELLEDLGEKLSRIERDDPPVVDEDIPSKEVHWVKPEFVGEVGFTEWTNKCRLRHPRFLGLRDDKSPKEVVREEAA